MTRLMTAGAALLALTVAACGGSDTTDDVVQAPTPGAQPVEVSETRADAATTRAALAFGMTSDELEDADLLSSENTKLGEVESLVLDAASQLQSVVVDLEGPGDIEVLVPVGQLTSITRGDDKDLVTTLTAAELQALPRWTGTAPAR